MPEDFTRADWLDDALDPDQAKRMVAQGMKRAAFRENGLSYPADDVRSGKRLDTKYPYGLVAYQHQDFIALWDERRNRHVCLPLPRKSGDLKAALTNLGY